jgi:hypothetical protein
MSTDKHDGAPAMPDWAPANGPWCLKAWLLYGDSTYDLCVREPNHEGECRCTTAGRVNHGNALYLGDHSSRLLPQK